MQYRVDAGGVLRGRCTVPGDKSISHRAVMLGAIAEGTTSVSGFLEGEDTLHTAAILARLGVPIERSGPEALRIRGVGLDGLSPPTVALDCGNAGTAMRLLAGLLAGQRFPSRLIGDASLSRRPMRRVLEPLRAMGARIDASAEGTAPLQIQPSPTGLRGIHYPSPIASAQVKSAVLLAGLYADGPSEVIEPHPTRDYTERMLERFGATIAYAPGRARLEPGARLTGRAITVPGDFSSAAFWLVGAAISPGSALTLERVGVHPRRIGLLHCLREMGADLRLEPVASDDGEPLADLHVRGGRLRGIAVPAERVPDMIDEFPAFLIAAACAEGDSHVVGASELRVKESDRLASMAQGLRSLGVDLDERPDGISLHGREWLRPSAPIDSAGDHRIAMSFAIAALRATGPLVIEAVENVATSFPDFDRRSSALGLAIRRSG
jgi:3-phosphoshikimate 1-carboxyvinyltransferase